MAIESDPDICADLEILLPVAVSIYIDEGMNGLKDSWVDSWVFGFLGSWIFGFLDSWILGFLDSLVEKANQINI